MCKFLKILANHTETEIYSGTVVEMILKDFKHAGSLISEDDLRGYKVKIEESVEFPLTDDDSLLLPSTAAVQVASILNILKEFKFNESSFEGDKNINETILSHHRIIEAFKHVFAMRSELTDSVDAKNVVKKLLSKEFAKSVAERIDDTRTFSPDKYSQNNFIAPDDHGTSHISMISETGDAISITSSINY